MINVYINQRYFLQGQKITFIVWLKKKRCVKIAVKLILSRHISFFISLKNLRIRKIVQQKPVFKHMHNLKILLKILI